MIPLGRFRRAKDGYVSRLKTLALERLVDAPGVRRMTVAWKTLAAKSAASLAPALTTIMSPAPLLMWNATASAPVGLYRLQPAEPLKAGDLIAARPSEPLANWLDKAGHLPRGVRLVKHIAAIAGQRVCRSSGALTIDGRTIARARARDRYGRRLPVWAGCHRLDGGEVFLLNPTLDSLDGRYFGPSRVTDLTGRATPIWTRGGR